MKYSVGLVIEVEAESADKAFAEVRTHYCVFNDPFAEIKTEEFHIEVNFKIDSVVEIEDGLRSAL